jgi:hypothetical protein
MVVVDVPFDWVKAAVVHAELVKGPVKHARLQSFHNLDCAVIGKRYKQNDVNSKKNQARDLGTKHGPSTCTVSKGIPVQAKILHGAIGCNSTC